MYYNTQKRISLYSLPYKKKISSKRFIHLFVYIISTRKRPVYTRPFTRALCSVSSRRELQLSFSEISLARALFDFRLPFSLSHCCTRLTQLDSLSGYTCRCASPFFLQSISLPYLVWFLSLYLSASGLYYWRYSDLDHDSSDEE